MLILIIGVAASVLSTIAFIPQAWYIMKTKDTQSISLPTYVIFVLSVLFWFLYGIAIGDVPIVASNLVCLLLGGIILWYKIKEVVSKGSAPFH